MPTSGGHCHCQVTDAAEIQCTPGIDLNISRLIADKGKCSTSTKQMNDYMYMEWTELGDERTIWGLEVVGLFWKSQLKNCERNQTSYTCNTECDWVNRAL